VQPIPHPEATDLVSLSWEYGTFQGGYSDMPQISDDVFQLGGVKIKTETVITIYVSDAQEWDGGSLYLVRKDIYIDGQYIDVGSTLYGSVKIIYHNDGKVEVYTGGTQ